MRDDERRSTGAGGPDVGDREAGGHGAGNPVRRGRTGRRLARGMAVVAAIVSGFVAPATVSALARDMTTGVWVFSEATEGVPDCMMVLKPDRAIGGQAIDLKGNCDAVMPGMNDAYAWFIRDDGDLVIIDATRRPLIQFERGGPKWFIRKRAEAQPLYLHYEAPSVPAKNKR